MQSVGKRACFDWGDFPGIVFLCGQFERRLGTQGHLIGDVVRDVRGRGRRVVRLLRCGGRYALSANARPIGVVGRRANPLRDGLKCGDKTGEVHADGSWLLPGDWIETHAEIMPVLFAWNIKWLKRRLRLDFGRARRFFLMPGMIPPIRTNENINYLRIGYKILYNMRAY